VVSEPALDHAYDLFIIGGGVNGTGIARDAAGRGLSVLLAEKGDLAQATSSASSKLFHGGLRYLEYFELRLVRKALAERDTLLQAMPHISWPMRFVLPYHSGMRFEADTPASRLLTQVMPWLKGRRPAWMIRFGLFLYDHLAGRSILPGTRTLNLRQDPAGAALKPEFEHAYEYSDGWVQDSRLVALNARDAKERGARILTRTAVTDARRVANQWEVTVRANGRTRTYRARMLVNAGGPWVESIVRDVAHLSPKAHIRLVRGSHIVTRRLFDHDRAYFFQGTDGRIIFALPYEEDFTLIGTTDQDHKGDPSAASCTDAEVVYLCDFASRYFTRPVTSRDVVWRFAGVRPLYDDGAQNASSTTRDYVLTTNTDGAPMLNIFGGKITTYRRLAEDAMAKIIPLIGGNPEKWTATAPLPGGDFANGDAPRLVEELAELFPFLDMRTCRRLVRNYGTEAGLVCGQAVTEADLGRHFGAGLYECEVRWLMDKEFAQTAEDIVWRRTRIGLRLTTEEIAGLDDWIKSEGKA
jgi:glycerol-3-phosphate dehydrogenase